MARHQGRLELTWSDKDKALLAIGDGRYDYTFVDPADHRVSEVRLLHEVEPIESDAPADRPDDLPAPTTDNLLITGDAMHVLDALAKIPVYAERYVGKVRLVYIDPPFNTGQAFQHYEDNIERSIWLTMLRDRLRQIKPLLTRDGSVWVHLDDEEVQVTPRITPPSWAHLARMEHRGLESLRADRRMCVASSTRRLVGRACSLGLAQWRVAEFAEVGGLSRSRRRRRRTRCSPGRP